MATRLSRVSHFGLGGAELKSAWRTGLGLSFRVYMGLRPTQRNEEHNRRRLRESGGPALVRETMDSRFRGNDADFHCLGWAAGHMGTPWNDSKNGFSHRL